MNTEHYRKLERMYLAANVNTQIFDTTTANISEGSAEIGLTVVPKYHHARDAMHGSVYFKLLDDAAFFAINSLVEDVFVLTKSYEIQFIRPVVEGKILATGTHLSDDGKDYIAEAELRNEEGKLVGSGKGIFVKSQLPLVPEIGYK